MVTHSISAGPEGSKKRLKRTLESAKIMGESLHKRAKLVAEDKYVMAVKLARGDPAQGIVTDNKLNLHLTFLDSIDRRRKKKKSINRDILLSDTIFQFAVQDA